MNKRNRNYSRVYGLCFMVTKAVEHSRCVSVLENHNPDSKVHGTNMGPIWGRQDPVGPHAGPMNFAILVTLFIFVKYHIYGQRSNKGKLSIINADLDPSKGETKRRSFWIWGFTLKRYMTVVKPSYLYNENPYNEMIPWIRSRQKVIMYNLGILLNQE